MSICALWCLQNSKQAPLVPELKIQGGLKLLLKHCFAKVTCMKISMLQISREHECRLIWCAIPRWVERTMRLAAPPSLDFILTEIHNLSMVTFSNFNITPWSWIRSSQTEVDTMSFEILHLAHGLAADYNSGERRNWWNKFMHIGVFE